MSPPRLADLETLWTVDEGLYADLMAPEAAEWARRALEPGVRETQTRYRENRALSMGRPFRAKLAKCARAGVEVKCGCPGKRDVRWYTCRQHLMCERCQRARSKRMGARIRAGLEQAWEGAPRNSMVVLVTLTLAHSGDVAADRAALALGWRRFYKRMFRFGYEKFPYVGVWECTPGLDGKGHVHMHIAAVWQYRDWGLLSDLWRDSCPTSTRINFIASHTVRSAAKYVSKYMSKGVQTSEFTPALRARVLHASYNTRQVFSSVRFWKFFEPCCQACNSKVVRATFRWITRGAPPAFIVADWTGPPPGSFERWCAARVQVPLFA